MSEPTRPLDLTRENNSIQKSKNNLSELATKETYSDPNHLMLTLKDY